MWFGKYHIGLRTLKTAAAVMCCIIFFHLTDRGSPMVATLSAVFALREDLSSTMTFGKSRILGNITGGIGGILYFYLLMALPNESIGETVLVPLFVLIVITISMRMENDKGIIGAVATLLFLCFSIPQSNSLSYTIERVIDTFIGTFFAIFWNYIIKSPLEDREEIIKSDEDVIHQKKAEIKKLQAEIEALKTQNME